MASWLLAGEQIQTLLRIIQDGAFAAGSGEVTQDHDLILRHMAAIQSKVSMARRMTVVLDAGNGLSRASICRPC